MALTFKIVCRLTRCTNKRGFVVHKYFSSMTDAIDSATNFETVDKYDKKIGLTKSEQNSILKRKPRPTDEMRTLKVALLGAPNAGKSTIANRIMGWKFAPVSGKIHTTRSQTMGVLTENNKQVMFLDTPGVIVPSKMKKHNLELSLLVDPHQALCDADMIMVVVDVSHIWGRSHLDPEVLKMLTFHQDKDSILILNKVDLLKTKQELLNASRILTQGHLEGKRYQHTQKLIRHDKPDLEELFKKCMDMKPGFQPSESKEVRLQSVDGEETPLSSNSEQRTIPLEIPYKLNLHNRTHWQIYYRKLEDIGRNIRDQNGWPFFKDIFMISALDGDGVFELKNYLLNSAKQSPWKYDGNVVTDQDPQVLAEQLVWEKLLDNLPKEIPYQINVKQILWAVGEDDLLRAQFELHCTKRRHVQVLLGKNGEMIQKISSEVKQELMNAFRREMSLQLIVKGNEKTLPKPKPNMPRKESENSI